MRSSSCRQSRSLWKMRSPFWNSKGASQAKPGPVDSHGQEDIPGDLQANEAWRELDKQVKALQASMANMAKQARLDKQLEEAEMASQATDEHMQDELPGQAKGCAKAEVLGAAASRHWCWLPCSGHWIWSQKDVGQAL